MRPIPLALALTALTTGLAAQDPQPAPQEPQPSEQGPMPPAPKVEAKKQKSIDEMNREELVVELKRLRKEIQRLKDSQVPASKVEAKLRERKPNYRQIPIAEVPEAPPPAAGTEATADGTEMPADAKVTVRLLGDAEKERLPKGAVLVVEGQPVFDHEVKQLEDWFKSYESNELGTPRQRAIQALIERRTVESSYPKQFATLRKRMDAIVKELDGGADFGELAKKRSEGPSSVSGGDLSFFARGGMVPEFASQAFGLKIGQVSKPFMTYFGIHVLKVTGRKKGKTPAEDQVRASHILLLIDKDQMAIQPLVRQAREGRSQVAVINDEWRKALPAAYR